MEFGRELGHLAPVRLSGEASDGRRQIRAVRVVADVGGALETVDDRAGLAHDAAVADADDVGEALASALPRQPDRIAGIADWAGAPEVGLRRGSRPHR